MNFKCRKVHITELCTVERAIKNKIYKAGSCYVKLSAVDGEIGQIQEDSTIDSRFAVFEPKEKMNCDYLLVSLEKSFPRFLHDYRTTINLSFDALRYFEIDWHDNEEVQHYIAQAFKTLQKEIDLIEAQIIQEKEIKRWYLNKMLIRERSEKNCKYGSNTAKVVSKYPFYQPKLSQMKV